MPLQLNLLHEEILQQRQRQRDPLKLSIYAGIGLAALLLLNYLWTGYRVLDSKRHLTGVQGEWAKVEPKVTTAHFVVMVGLDPFPKPAEAAPSERRSKPKKEDS